ncbi:hypothetical protein AAG570_009329 [Ranatra chinensis]|uniref:Amine oxidase domain-containing protein n=1 Tax=Ranatra chinensis TaxID=642074 RepID=A0ABD0Z9U6_9HEMI
MVRAKDEGKSPEETTLVVTVQQEKIKKKHKLVHCCEQDVVLVKPPPDPLPPGPLPRVVIIGAGMAGLSAAQRLLSRGFNNFTVVEAKGRPGGRIHTCKMESGNSVELGAQYIEGGSVANPVWNLAGEEGLAGERQGARSALVLLAGRAVDASRVRKLVLKLKKEAAALFTSPHPPDTTLAEYFEDILRSGSDHYFRTQEKNDAPRILEGALAEMKAQWGVEDLRQMSASQYGSYVETPGGRLKLPRGVSGLLTPLLKPLDEGAIKYNKIVQTVEWIPNKYGSRALVRCCDGEELPADYVVVTVSLGVLKAQADRLFCPRLPHEKLSAVESLGYGCIDKIFFEYDRPFWTREGAAVLYISHPQDLTEIPGEDWSRGIGTVRVDSERTLEVTVAGRAATRALELNTDEEVAMQVTKTLRVAAGDGSLPCPSRMVRSEWTTDLAFGGARSFLAAGASVGDQCRLAAPVSPPRCPRAPPVLLFAGEATVPGQFGTLQAARISGVREADRIIEITLSHGCSF